MGSQPAIKPEEEEEEEKEGGMIRALERSCAVMSTLLNVDS